LERHVDLVSTIAFVKFWVDEKLDELEKELVVKRLIPLSIHNDSDNRIAVDAETGEVGHVMHHANISNTNVSFLLMGINDVHAAFVPDGQIS
jgi:hypothetical protein